MGSGGLYTMCFLRLGLNHSYDSSKLLVDVIFQTPQSMNSSSKKNNLKKFYVCGECFAYMYVCAPHGYLIPTEVKKGY